MRVLATALSSVLAFGTLVALEVAPCRADGPPAAVSSATAPVLAPNADAAPRPASEEEERAYARREAESPAAQEFTGGFIGFLILVALVVIIILLVQKG